MVLPPRYTDARVLGEGSFGTVYAARDSVLDRTVAVKILRDATARQRFSREVHVSALLGAHPHVVTIHDAGEWCDRPYFVMELLDGHVYSGVPQRVALRWLAQAAAALDFVHAHGIVHRDIKPANLLLDAHGDVRLTDFGVARTGTITALTEEGAVVGTPGYLAPEVAVGGVATAASDLYSFAVVARELLGDVPARALAHDSAARYATAAELVAVLGGEDEPTRIVPSRMQTLIRIPRTRIATPVGRPPRHRAVRRGLGVLSVAIVAAAAAAGGAFVAGRASANGTPAPKASGPAVVRQTCALSTVHHNANIVATGVGAMRFCRAQSHLLALRGDDWTYRAGHELLQPDRGSGSLATICALQRGSFRVRVYDSGARAIGRDVCDWYASGGWRSA